MVALWNLRQPCNPKLPRPTCASSSAIGSWTITTHGGLDRHPSPSFGMATRSTSMYIAIWSARIRKFLRFARNSGGSFRAQRNLSVRPSRQANFDAPNPGSALCSDEIVAPPAIQAPGGRVRVLYDVSGSTVEILANRDQIGGRVMAGIIRKSRMRQVPLSEIKDDLSRFLREAGKQEIVITRHGKPAGVLIGFESEDDWFDYRLENDPRFLRRIEGARKSLRAGRGTRLEDLPE